MRGLAQGAMLLGALGLFGCGTSSDSTTAPRLAATGPSFSVGNGAAGSGEEQHVTGSVAIILPLHGNALEHYSVSAIQHKDGSTSGEFEEYSSQDGGQRIHAKIACVGITGNTARLAARIDETNVPFGPVGSYVVWTVIDNGEGAKSAPDQSTDVFFNGTEAQAQFHCRVGFNLAPFFPSIRGNLQVD